MIKFADAFLVIENDWLLLPPTNNIYFYHKIYLYTKKSSVVNVVTIDLFLEFVPFFSLFNELKKKKEDSKKTIVCMLWLPTDFDA